MDEKFNMDLRKFSKNYEYSLFFDEYNFGVRVNQMSSLALNLTSRDQYLSMAL